MSPCLMGAALDNLPGEGVPEAFVEGALDRCREPAQPQCCSTRPAVERITPAAVSRCPTFVFTEPIRQN